MIVKPPSLIHNSNSGFSVFLAGTIDMGDSEDWQAKTSKILDERGLLVFNPRRDDFDKNLVQSIETPQLYQQMDWEFTAMERSGTIIFNFLATSKSPITFMELGLHAKSDKRLLVCCPDSFYRAGNVQFICQKFNIPLFTSMEDLLQIL